MNQEDDQPSPLSGEEGRARIEHEDDVVNHRVSWLIGSQAFLLTAFVILKNNPAYYTRGVAQIPGYLRSSHLLVYVIITIGGAVSLSTTVGIFAAFMAIRAWRDRVDPGYQHRIMAEYWIVRLAGLAAMLPGPVLLSIWLILFISEWSGLRDYLTPLDVGLPILAAVLTSLVWLAYVRGTYFGRGGRGRP
jgi:hypothetical protein